MKEDEIENQVPFQILSLIRNLKDRTERTNTRSNYRSRLDLIRNVIDTAIMEYDLEMGTSAPKKRIRR